MTKVFIDGSAGTTGLRIYERLGERRDIELVTLPDAVRKDPEARREALNSADVAFLCLPDQAAIEAVGMIENPDVAVIDTSTAHRTAPGWTYGFPELAGQREKIAASKRIANPGCHASGFIALVAPLRAAGLIPASARLCCFSLTGYSGGGKKMIADYEGDNTSALTAPRAYGLTQSHKHLPEMAAVCGLDMPPVFTPVVSSYYAGMEVTVPLFGADPGLGIDEVRAAYRDYYAGERLIRFSDDCDEGGFLSASAFSGRDDMQIAVFGNDERMTAVARFDNLGKGASGAAIQNLNILLGVDETSGLNY